MMSGLSLSICSIYGIIDSLKMNIELKNTGTYKSYKIENTNFNAQYIDVTNFKSNLKFKSMGVMLGKGFIKPSFNIGNIKEEAIKDRTIRYTIEGKNIDMSVSTNQLTVISENHNYSCLMKKLKQYGINHYDFDNSIYYNFKLEKVLPTDYALYNNNKLISIYRNRLECIDSHTKIGTYIVLFSVGAFFFGLSWNEKLRKLKNSRA